MHFKQTPRRHDNGKKSIVELQTSEPTIEQSEWKSLNNLHHIHTRIEFLKRIRTCKLSLGDCISTSMTGQIVQICSSTHTHTNLTYFIESKQTYKILKTEMTFFLHTHPTNLTSCSDQTSNGPISMLRCHPWISNADTTQYLKDL